jgi:hypothetical protein
MFKVMIRDNMSPVAGKILEVQEKSRWLKIMIRPMLSLEFYPK